MSDDARRPEEIEADIDTTRGELGDTVDAIKNRVSPENVKREVTSQAGDVIQELKVALVEKMDELLHGAGGGIENITADLGVRIKENPVPAALIGVGISWLVMSSSKSQEPPTHFAARAERASYPFAIDKGSAGGRQGEPHTSRAAGDQEPGVAAQAKGRVAAATGGAKEQAQAWGEQATEKAGEIAGAARESWHEAGAKVQGLAGSAQQGVAQGAQHVEEGFQRTLRANPLAVGAAALAVGAALGLALPSTRQEDALMGEARDELADKAAALAGDVAAKAKHVAEATADDVKETVREEAEKEGLQPEAAAAGMKDAAHDAANSLQKSTAEAIDKGREGATKATEAAKRIAKSAAETARKEAKDQQR